jgi:hypothetical protein
MELEEVVKLLVKREGWEDVCVVYCIFVIKNKLSFLVQQSYSRGAPVSASASSASAATG